MDDVSKSDDEALKLGILLSKQEEKYGTNMLEMLKEEDEDEVERIQLSSNLNRNDAILIIFERRYGSVSCDNSSDVSLTTGENSNPYTAPTSSSTRSQSNIPPQEVDAPGAYHHRPSHIDEEASVCSRGTDRSNHTARSHYTDRSYRSNYSALSRHTESSYLSRSDPDVLTLRQRAQGLLRQESNPSQFSQSMYVPNERYRPAPVPNPYPYQPSNDSHETLYTYPTYELPSSPRRAERRMKPPRSPAVDAYGYPVEPPPTHHHHHHHHHHHPNRAREHERAYRERRDRRGRSPSPSPQDYYDSRPPYPPNEYPQAPVEYHTQPTRSMDNIPREIAQEIPIVATNVPVEREESSSRHHHHHHSPVDEDKIKQLENLGFERKDCKKALRKYDNIDTAANYLFEKTRTITS